MNFPMENGRQKIREKNKYVPNPVHEKWLKDREAVWESLPTVLCVEGDDDYITTVCLDCLGLQKKGTA